MWAAPLEVSSKNKSKCSKKFKSHVMRRGRRAPGPAPLAMTVEISGSLVHAAVSARFALHGARLPTGIFCVGGLRRGPSATTVSWPTPRGSWGGTDLLFRSTTWGSWGTPLRRMLSRVSAAWAASLGISSWVRLRRWPRRGPEIVPRVLDSAGRAACPAHHLGRGATAVQTLGVGRHARLLAHLIVCIAWGRGAGVRGRTAVGTDGGRLCGGGGAA